MLRSIEGREVFREFLRSEYSEDNLLFWLACEDLKKETDSALVDEKARIIYEDYVSILSPKEVPSKKILLAHCLASGELGDWICTSGSVWRSSLTLTCDNPTSVISV